MNTIKFLVMLLIINSMFGCGVIENQKKENKAIELANYNHWLTWHESCTKQWTDFECRLLYRTPDNADKAMLLEGFRKDREAREARNKK